MKFEEYIPLAMRTLPEGRSTEENLVNACLGLAGEIAEYETADNRADKLEELGDIYWYIALMVSNYDYTPMYIKHSKGSFLTPVGAISDVVKKTIFQGHWLSKGVIDIHISKLLSNIEYDCNILGVTPSQIMGENVAKLKERFPQGFEVERSVNRA